MVYFDEKRVADSIIKNNRFKYGTPQTYEIKALAKHLREKGFSTKGKLRSALVALCQEIDNTFSEVIYHDDINDAINSALVDDFRRIPVIHVFAKEIGEIRRVKNFKLQKILFTMLVYAKAFPKSGYNAIAVVDWLLKSLFHQSKTRISYYSFLDKYKKELEKLGLIEYRVGRNRKGVYARYILKFVEETGLEIYRFENEVDMLNSAKIYQDIIIGGELLWCVDCGKEVKKESNRQKRCSECQRLENRNKVRRHRKSDQ